MACLSWCCCDKGRCLAPPPTTTDSHPSDSIYRKLGAAHTDAQIAKSVLVCRLLVTALTVNRPLNIGVVRCTIAKLRGVSQLSCAARWPVASLASRANCCSDKSVSQNGHLGTIPTTHQLYGQQGLRRKVSLRYKFFKRRPVQTPTPCRSCSHQGSPPNAASFWLVA